VILGITLALLLFFFPGGILGFLQARFARPGGHR